MIHTLLILEDDQTFAEALAGEFRERGSQVHSCHSLKALRMMFKDRPAIDHAIVDLKLQGESGLEAVSFIKSQNPECKILVLTGYGSIATAVQAMKLGAVNYIAKPASIEDIAAAFLGQVHTIEDCARPSLYRHEREYIEKIVSDYAGNISQAAKALGIHRQSLQRKLRKFT